MNFILSNNQLEKAITLSWFQKKIGKNNSEYKPDPLNYIPLVKYL